MAVALDATGTAADGLSTSSSYTGITVGTGANRGLLVILNTQSGTTPTGVTATWDSGGTNQAMTQVATQASTLDSGFIKIFGLVAPTSGNKTCLVSWTGSANFVVSAISFTGVNQISVGSAFPNTHNASGTTTTSSSNTVNSATGDFCIEVIGVPAFPVTAGGTQWFTDSNTPTYNIFGQYVSASAGSTALTNTFASNSWYSVALDISQVTTIPIGILGMTSSEW